MKIAQILREEKFELGGTKIPCTVMRIEYAPPRGAPGIESFTRTFWIDKQRNLVLQHESVTTGNLFPMKPFEHAETRHKIRYTLVSVQNDFADSLFAYAPPQDFREVDTLESPMRRTATTDMVGKPAPELTGKMLDGTPFTLSSLRGKLVLLDFWATWCGPCRDQLPLIAKLYRETKDQGLVLLGVDDDETPQKAIAYLEENHYDWPSLFDGKILIAREKFKVRGIPTLVLIDKQGQIAEYRVGSGSQTEKAIRAALRKQGIQVR